MESRHDLSVDHARLMTGGYMDPQTTGQLRPPYGDLCRPPGTDASSLSAYHSRYLASMPLSTGSSFPFLGGMFTGSLPGPPTSPFRTPSTPGVNNMRQFWPPTPPPDGGYGRYSMNTNLFPLFGAPSPDNGPFLTQGLVSRLGSTTHLSPLIDHKEHSFFSHGIGLGSPLTPTSHVASPSPFPHLIPSLERHPAYGGHMTLGNKELEDLQHDADDSRLVKGHYDCLMKHDIPSSRQDRPKSKNDGKHCCDKSNDDCCKLSPPCISHDNGKSHDDIRSNSRMENKTHRQPTTKVQPCKIEVSHSPALKPDLLSPPIESPKSDTTSPNRNSKKMAHSPFVSDSISVVPVSIAPYEESPTRCSQCCANIKDIGVATKLGSGENKESTTSVTAQQLSDPIVPQKSHTPVFSSLSTPVATTASLITSDNLQETAAVAEGKPYYEKPSSSSPVITVTDIAEKSLLDQSLCKSSKTNSESPSSKLNNSSLTMKHVTAAVIPTAPKQTVHREVHPETNCSTVIPDHSKGIANSEQSVLMKEQSSFCADNSVKLEFVESSSMEKTQVLSNFPSPANSSFCNRVINKNLSTSCKVKDMIKNTCSAKQMPPEKDQELTPSKNSDFDSSKILSNSPSPSSKLSTTVGISTAISPTIMSKNNCKNGKIQCVPLDNVRKCSPFKEDTPVMKSEAVNSRLDCEFTQKANANWTKARVSPFNWQANNSQDDQAINLTVSKKVVKPEPNETVAVAQAQDIQQTNIKIAAENTTIANSGVIGVCHPNPSPIAMNKIKATPAMSSISNFASISVLNQPAEQSTEVHILHRSSKSSFPIVNRNGASPVPLKSTISHVTANTSIHRSLKTERLTTKRGKISEMDKINHSGRTTLATLAPKLSKNVNFGKDVQTSHTISASSSVSSTSIVFPATVNPCIPVGIAIAQQRQDSSTAASIGKSQPSVPSSTPSVLSSNSHLTTNRVPADLQTQEIIRDQKGQDLPISNNPTPVDTNLLVTQGPTIVSRQWESEALTRTALPSSWVAHGSIVAPAVWLGQGAYTATAAPASNTVPSVAVNSLESSPISLPPGGYQLARDSITGHLLLIPTANIELMDRTSVWPTFNSSAGNLPIQQLVTQQQHTQFEQVLPQTESLKTADAIDNNCNITTCDMSGNTSVKAEEKIEDVSGQVPSVPLATGQTYAFTTFPTQCDPASFSYVLQSSTVMHLAHTQTTASIQTESGRRSQATSPLHCATPSPPPNTCSVQVSVTEDEEESDNESDIESCDATQVQVSGQSQSVTTAIQVDMDSQTNSEEDEDEERKPITEKSETLKVEMSDSANQTESVPSESPKSEPDTEDVIEMQVDKCEVKEIGNPSSPIKVDSVIVPSISIKDDIVSNEPGLEIVTSETELAPSLPVESKPVMDFIDHHGLNLLVDSIEEFASREQEAHQTEKEEKDTEPSNVQCIEELKNIPEVVKAAEVSSIKEVTSNLPQKSYSPPYKTIDTTCTDGLGLLCALAEQRFFEEALNDDSKAKPSEEVVQDHYSYKEKPNANMVSENSSIKEDSLQSNSLQSNSIESSPESSVSSSPSHREATELEMRLQIEELQKKYKQKQRELELLRNKKEKENSEEEIRSTSTPPKPKKVVVSLKNVPASHPKSPVGFSSHNISKSLESKSSQNLQLPVTECRVNDSNQKENTIVDNECHMENNDISSKKNIPAQKIPSAIPAHDSSSSHSNDSNSISSDSSSDMSDRSSSLNESVKSDKSSSVEQKSETQLPDQEFDKNDKSKTPFFDEQAWFVRRSERIFLSDARTAAVPAPVPASDKSNRKQTSSSNKVSPDVIKEKKEQHSIKPKTPKPADDNESKKNKSKVTKPKLSLLKKRSLSVSSDSDSSSDEESSEVESSDAASSTSENLPLSTFVESSSNKATLPDRQKRLSTDSEYSSGQSEDLPLSVLMEHKVPELKSCILKPDDLQENARLLVLDEGLFYAGYITKSEDPDMYGILIDGDRAARPHMFSKEEILNAAVLEVKPSHKVQLPEGSRICAFWSQQYRCLYPGTVTKASSPLPDPSMLYVEFDDGDSGRIPLNDIRMLPSDFPIVSMEPNPFMILGKRRSRAQSQNNTNINSDLKNANESNTQKSDKDKTEHKKHKNPDKANKKSHSDGKIFRDKIKCKSKSPSANSRSRSSSKSSLSGHSVGKSQSSVIKKEPGEENKKKVEVKSKHSEKKSKDNTENLEKSKLKPKKHKKHKDDHHKHHHHHHHKHHHHKKHKTDKSERSHSSDETVIHSGKSSGDKSLSNSHSSSAMRLSEQEYDTFILENSKSDLTVKIKKSPSPHTNHEETAASGSKSSNVKRKSAIIETSSSSSSDEDIITSEPPRKKVKKSKQSSQSKPSKRKDRVPSVEKSKIAAFLPVRQLWRWSGKSFRRPGAKGKAKKEFYRAIQRGKETIRVGDCAVFLSTGRPHLPYIGRIETMWESWGGKMDVKVKWFYHPEETKSGKKLSQLKGALFQSPHFDENDVQTISHKCEVLSWSEYQQKNLPENVEDNNDTYFLAGTYDPIMGTLILEPGVPNISSSNTSDP